MSLHFILIVARTYNRGELIKDCMDSLISQNYPRDGYEIIVVDEGSSYDIRRE